MLPASRLFLSGPLALSAGLALAQQPLVIDLSPGYAPNAFDSLRVTRLSNDGTPWIELGAAYERVTSDGTLQGTVPAQEPANLFALAESLETGGGGLLAMVPTGSGSLPGANLLYQPADGSPAVAVAGLGRSPGTYSLPTPSGDRLLARIGAEVWTLAQQDGGPIALYRIGANGVLVGEIPLPSLPELADLYSASIHSFGNRALLFTRGETGLGLFAVESTGDVRRLGNFAGAPFGGQVVTADLLQGKLIGLSFAGADSGIWFVDFDLGLAPVGDRTPLLAEHGLVVDGSTAYALSSWVSEFPDPTLTRVLKFSPSGGLATATLPLSSAANSRFMAIVGERLVFAGDSGAGSRPWTSNGSTASTQELANIPLVLESSNSRSFQFGTAQDKAVFVGRTSDDRKLLFRTDGTTIGTVAIDPFPTAIGGSARAGYALAGERLVVAPIFADGSLPTLRSFDLSGSQAEALLTADYELPAGTQASNIDQFLGTAGGTLFAAANDQGERQVAVTDGSLAGTKLLTDLTPTEPQGSFNIPNEPRFLGTLGNRAVFTYAQDVYALDLVTEQLSHLIDVAAGNVTRQGDSLLFTGYRITPGPGSIPGQEQIEGALYRTRGTQASTEELFPLDFAVLPSGELTALDDRFLIALNTPGQGLELWTSDGTIAGTSTLIDAAPGAGSSLPRNLVRVGDRIYFTTSNPKSRLWITDGTSAGTQLVFESAFGALPLFPSAIGDLVALGDRLMFAARDTGGEFEPWITDGTPGGTSRLADLPSTATSTPGVALEEQYVQIAIGERAWFALRSANPDALDLWTSDGTAAGTVKLMALTPPKLPTVNPSSVNVNLRFFDIGLVGQVLFVNEDFAGREPWISDGTVAGTRRLVDLYPGPDDSLEFPSGSFAAQRAGQLLFSARFPLVGAELGVLPLSIAGGWAKARLGESCGGALGRPEIDATGSATLGQTVSIEVAGLAPQGLVILQFGAQASLPLGAGQCALQLTTPQFLGFAVTSGDGAANFPLSVPQNPNLIDRAAYFQALALDPSAGFLGLFSLSQVLEIAIGG